MKKIVFLLLFLTLTCNAMGKKMDQPKFYTDKNRYFSFIPPEGFDSKKEFPNDPRSKVIFTNKLPGKKDVMQLVIIAYLIDQPRSLSSLETFMNQRFTTLKQNMNCTTAPISKYTLAQTTCLRSEIFLTDNKAKTLVVLGYPQNKLCLDITFTAPLTSYYDFLPKILESLETFIIIKGVDSQDKKIFDAQQVIWKKKHAAFYIAEGSYEQSKTLLEELLDNEPENSHLNFQMGLVYQHLNLPMSAITHYRKAIDAEPYYWEAFVQLGNICLQSEDYNKAKGYYERAMQINPKSFEAKLNLAGVYRKLDNLQKSADLYDELLIDYPNNPILLFNTGRLLAQSTNFEEAKQYFSKVLKFDKKNVPAMVNLAACHIALNEYAKADKILKKAIKLDPASYKAQELINKLKEIKK